MTINDKEKEKLMIKAREEFGKEFGEGWDSYIARELWTFLYRAHGYSRERVDLEKHKECLDVIPYILEMYDPYIDRIINLGIDSKSKDAEEDALKHAFYTGFWGARRWLQSLKQKEE